MKKVLFPILVLILLLTTAVPAMAKAGRSSMILVGYIAEINDTDQTFELEVVKANKLAKFYIGKTVTIFTNSTTSFRVHLEDDTVEEISFDDLDIGYVVSVSVRTTGDPLIADRVTWETMHTP